MTLYRFIIRYDHAEEDSALADKFLKVVKRGKDFRGAIGRKTKPHHETNHRDGEIWFVHGTPDEVAIQTEYEKA